MWKCLKLFFPRWRSKARTLWCCKAFHLCPDTWFQSSPTTRKACLPHSPVTSQHVSQHTHIRISSLWFFFLGFSSPPFSSLPVKVPSPSDLKVTNFSGSEIMVRWAAAADDVVYYLIKWISLSEGDLRQVRRERRGNLLKCKNPNIYIYIYIYIYMYICLGSRVFSWRWMETMKERSWREWRRIKNTRSLCLHFMEMELRVRLLPFDTVPVSPTYLSTNFINHPLIQFASL